VRVWTTRTARSAHDEDEDDNAEHADEQGNARPWRRRLRRYPTEALIFDTETEPGPSQRLRFLVWRVYRDRTGAPPGHLCVEEGIAYADDLPDRDPDGYQLLVDHVSDREADIAAGLSRPGVGRRVVCEPVSWWLQERFFLYGYKHRDRCAVVGFNLPFDLGRLASYWTAARGYYRGGWSLGLWGTYDAEGRWKDLRFHPRLLMKAIDPRRTLFRWGSLKRGDEDGRGPEARFIDLRTLAFALTDNSYSLEGACAAFGDPFEKDPVSFETVTPKLIDYAFEDVAHTSLLYRNTMAELARHEGVDLQPHRLYSPATVGARYLEAMGVRRPLEKFTDLSDEQLGWENRPPRPDDEAQRTGGISEELLGYSMGAFFGGRAEARVVRTHVPIVHVDFTSMYPAINALLGTWPLLRAEQITTTDAAEAVRTLLADPQLLECCLTPELWREVGATLVEIEPDGDILPVRARLDPDSDDYGIGVNPLSYDGRLWYALPDIIAATLLNPSDKPSPRITRAIRLTPQGIQPALQPVRLRGGSPLDPAAENTDPFVVMIEERARVKADPSLSKDERDRLELFLKITANATAYGSLARLDRRDLAIATPVTIRGPDTEPREQNTPNPEDPGPYCFPPVAASITAGARLMLALLERIVRDHGGTYAFCDTDSMAIIASPELGAIECPTPDGSGRLSVLSWETVRTILDRFEDLNPYDPELLRPWKIEHDSLDEQLWCYAISAKRYCLYRRGPDGTVDLVAATGGTDEASDDGGGEGNALTDWSEHGLGLYLDPTAEDPDRPERDEDERRIWMRDAWEWILRTSDGENVQQPHWADRYALTRFTVSSPTLADWFTGYNDNRPRDEWIRPGSFGLIAHAEAAARGETNTMPKPEQALPTAPYDRTAANWPRLTWYDRRDGRPIRVITAQQRSSPDAFADALQRGDTVIQTLSQVLGRYSRRPEHKSLAPDGTAVGSETRGLLARRPFSSSPAITELTGKEGNKLTERLSGEITDFGAHSNYYGNRTDPWAELYMPILKELGAARIIEETSMSSSAVYGVLNATVDEPHAANRVRYQRVALAHARKRLAQWDIPPPDAPASVAALYVRERHQRGEDVRRCQWCGQPLPPQARSDARYDSDTCRKTAARARARGPEASTSH
jgi:hypothetical protein